jgi:polysaccharide biosynthesis transport protein
LRKRELDEVEEKLTKFRIENQGRLPEERSNLQAAAAAIENRISNINQGINRATQDKMLLETRLTTLKEQMKQVGAEESPAAMQQQAKNDRLASIEQGILRAETELEAMRQNYRENHPDMRRMMANIAALKRGPAQKKSNPLQARQLRGYEAEIAATQSLIEARNMEIENYQKELQAAERNLRQQQGRLEGIPASVSEYDQLLRERMIAQAKYEEATKKAGDSQMSTEVQRRKQGENLELLDPASLPLNPTQPKRPMIIGAAAGIGLVIGLFLAGAREMKDTTLKNLKDVRAYTQLVVLGSIPLIENDLVLRRRKRLAWLAWSTACLAGVAIMAGSVIFYYATKV